MRNSDFYEEYKINEWSLQKIYKSFNEINNSKSILSCELIPLFSNNINQYGINHFDSYSYTLDFIRSQCNIDNMKQTIVDFDIIINNTDIGFRGNTLICANFFCDL